MNRDEKELKSLTWKYFWRRKTQEVLGFIKGAIKFCLVIFIVSIPFFTFVFFINSIIGGETYPLPSKILYPLFFIEIFAFIVFGLVTWLRSNWKLATQDAVQELKIRRYRR